METLTGKRGRSKRRAAGRRNGAVAPLVAEESVERMEFAGDDLERARLARGVTLEQLEEATGIDAGALAAFERVIPELVEDYDVVPSINHVLRILAALKARISDVCFSHSRERDRLHAVYSGDDGRKAHLSVDGPRLRRARLRAKLSPEAAARRADVPLQDLLAVEKSETDLAPMFVPIRLVELYHGPAAPAAFATYLRRPS
jgi:transcriptional regulator with XRE-family HTH domain